MGECLLQDNGDSIERVAPYFKLPVIALVLITILNDGTIISIAYDNVIPSAKPESWDLQRIYWIAATLGSVAVASSLVLLYWGLDSWSPTGVLSSYGMHALDYDEIMMMMYLKISLSDFMTVFSARTHGFFFSRKPGKLLFVAACFATCVSTLLAIYWPFTEMRAISFKLAMFVWVYCLFWFFVQDLAKVFISYLLDHAYYGNVYEGAHDSRKYRRSEAQRQNRILMGSTFISSDSLMRDSFVAGRAVSSAGAGAQMSLDQAMDRLVRLEKEMKALRGVIQTASAKK